MATNEGILCIVKTPAASKNQLLQAKEAVAHCIILGDETRISACHVGTRHALVEVDAANAIDCSLNEFAPGIATVTSLITESTSITFNGDILKKIKHSTIEHAIHPSLKITYSCNNSVITITGFWNHVQKARESIQSLLLQSIDLVDDYVQAKIGPGDDETSVPLHPLMEQFHDQHSSLQHTSHYDMIRDVPSDVVALMKHNHVGFQQGVEYNDETNTVHFTFSNSEDLHHALNNFEEAYSNLIEAGVDQCTVSIPHGIHSEEIGLLISELENKYEHTVITWVPENLEVLIISTAVDKVARNLKELMESKEQKSEGNQAMKKNKDGISDWLRKNMLGHIKHTKATASSPYKAMVKLNFKSNQTLILRHGDLLDESVDAIVNPANPHLNHGAGIAKQINERSGNIVHYHCKQLLKEKDGYIPTGTAAITEAGGNLKCFFVIHAVGPNAHEIKSLDQCAQLLQSAVKQALSRGFEKKINSLAIPAISSGIFGMDKDIVAETIIDTLVEYQKKPHPNILNDIRIVIWDKETYLPFLNYISSIEASLIQMQ